MAAGRTKFWFSHPYRRWSTFLPFSLTTELLRSKARVYLVQGTKDTSTPVTAFDVAQAELAVHHRDVTAERLEGADHGFRTEAMPNGSPEGFKAVFGRVLSWFLPPAAPPATKIATGAKRTTSTNGACFRLLVRPGRHQKGESPCAAGN